MDSQKFLFIKSSFITNISNSLLDRHYNYSLKHKCAFLLLFWWAFRAGGSCEDLAPCLSIIVRKAIYTDRLTSLQLLWYSSWERKMLLLAVDWKRLHLERYISGAYDFHLGDPIFQFGGLKNWFVLKNYVVSFKHIRNLCLDIFKIRGSSSPSSRNCVNNLSCSAVW